MGVFMKWIRVWVIGREIARGFMAHNVMRLSAAVAFYSLLSLAPIVVLAVAVAGFVFGEEAAKGGLVDQFRRIVGDAGAEVIRAALVNAKSPGEGIFATIFGIVMLLIGASGVFSELRDAMNVIWDVDTTKTSGFWKYIRSRFLSFGMVLGACFLLLSSLILSAGLSGFSNYLETHAPGLPSILNVANLVISTFVITLLFAMLFKYLPDIRLRWRDVLPGAIVTAILFGFGKSLIGLYLGKAGVATPYGAAGSVVVLVVWVYYSCLIVFAGVELTRAYSGLSVKMQQQNPVRVNDRA
jgi:membrane protein